MLFLGEGGNGTNNEGSNFRSVNNDDTARHFDRPDMRYCDPLNLENPYGMRIMVQIARYVIQWKSLRGN